MNRPSPVIITETAATRIKHLIETRGQPSKGIRLGVNAKGCSGLKYEIDFADNIEPLDEVVEDQGVTVVIDNTSLMYLIGTKIDWVRTGFDESFKFTNPNSKGECGCGESFRVE
jgi:iron-sulfur cluster assembly protein